MRRRSFGVAYLPAIISLAKGVPTDSDAPTMAATISWILTQYTSESSPLAIDHSLIAASNESDAKAASTVSAGNIENDSSINSIARALSSSDGVTKPSGGGLTTNEAFVL